MGLVFAQTTVFSDDFSTDQSTSWTTSGQIGASDFYISRLGADWGGRRNTSPAQLELTNDASATTNVVGWVFGYAATANFDSPYNTTLSSNSGVVTWYVNMRQIRSDPAGFASANYGAAFILAGSSTTAFNAGTGYALALGQSGTTDPLRLVKYSAGITALTNIITSNTTGLTDFGANYLSVKVTYDPSTNTWEMFLRDDGASAFTDPMSGTLTSQGTAVDNTYTSSSLGYIGGYWQGSTGATQTAFFDNVTVQVTEAGVSAPTTQASNLSFTNVLPNQMDVSWTSGNGTKRIVIINKTNNFTNPTDGTDPTANAVYGGSGEQVVYNNNGNSFTVSGLTSSTTYWFRAYEFNGSGAATKYLTTTATNNPNSQATSSSVVPPTVTTASISSITATSASGGGNVTADGGGTVSARGVCWNTTGTPDIINDSYTTNGSGTGSFTSSLTGLTENTPYYVRAYATNSAGTGYGDVVQFTTLKAEPTNHVIMFTCGSETISSITVTWTDAAKTTPDGYIIKGSDVGYSSIVDPIDGITETWGTLVHTVSQGTQSYTFTGLNDNTTYYFKIYPYTNSGTDVNYKTDGTVPQDAATTLENFNLDPGDIAVIGYEGDSPDWFSIVLLVDIPEGTVVYFTDNGFNDTGALNTTEGTIAWTVPAGGLTASSVVKFTGDTWSVDQGSVTVSGGFNLATGGDQIIVYQGSSSTPSFIYAISSLPWVASGTISSNTTYLPTGLVDGETAFDFSTEYDNGYYNVIPFSGTHDELLASIADETNWLLSSTALTAPAWDITLEEDVNPVELASFTATISAQNYITLTWVTQTETGMRGYYIYRDSDSDFAGAQNVSPLIPSANSSQMQTYMFEDTEVFETGNYFYWLQTNDMDGTVGFHGPVSVFFNALGDNPTPVIPLVTELKAVYPNPFNPTVFIPFSLAKDGNVSFKIYNARGQIVKHFELGSKAAGNYRITWDGTDYHGNALSNGVYQIVMSAGTEVFQTKTTLLK